MTDNEMDKLVEDFQRWRMYQQSVCHKVYADTPKSMLIYLEYYDCPVGRFSDDKKVEN